MKKNKRRLTPAFMAAFYGACGPLWLCVWHFRGGGAGALFCGVICLLAAAAWLLWAIGEKQKRP